MKTSEVLYRAAEYISKHGWAQGVPQGTDGGVCMLEAIARVGKAEVVPASFALYEAVGPPVWFNDRICETADDAVVALKKAAGLARQKEMRP